MTMPKNSPLTDRQIFDLVARGQITPEEGTDIIMNRPSSLVTITIRVPKFLGVLFGKIRDGLVKP